MKELLNGLIGPVTGIIDKIVTDKDQAAKLAHDIATQRPPSSLKPVALLSQRGTDVLQLQWQGGQTKVRKFIKRNFFSCKLDHSFLQLE